MLSERDARVAGEFATRVRGRFPEARIWVFGSRARGTPAADSDLDVCSAADHDLARVFRLEHPRIEIFRRGDALDRAAAG